MSAAKNNGKREVGKDALGSLIQVLDFSMQGLVDQVEQLTPQQLRQRAYPSEWTVADVLSHLGSGATIMRLRLDGDVDMDAMQAIWGEWNAKDPDAQAVDALEADNQLQ